jgi:HAD superfamily hydrolase (TIGR01484 family)
MDALCRVIGTKGVFIAENGGVYRIEYGGELRLDGDRSKCLEAFHVLEAYFKEKRISLQLYSDRYRFTDIAFARTVSSDEVRDVLNGHPIKVIDTGYAIHLQVDGVSKATALDRLARELGLVPSDFLAIGDSMNDIEMLLKAGIGVAVANAHPQTKKVASWVTGKMYG